MGQKRKSNCEKYKKSSRYFGVLSGRVACDGREVRRMKCPRCQKEMERCNDVSYCSKCGFPVNTSVDNGRARLRKVMFDADAKALVVNDIRYDTVRAFSMKCEERKCTLTVTRDEIFEVHL